MKFFTFIASALALAASASSMIIEPVEGLESRDEYGGHGQTEYCREWSDAWVTVKPTAGLNSTECPAFMAACGELVKDLKYTMCTDSPSQPGMFKVRCIEPPEEGRGSPGLDVTDDALLKMDVKKDWKGKGLGGNTEVLCAKPTTDPKEDPKKCSKKE